MWPSLMMRQVPSLQMMKPSSRETSMVCPQPVRVSDVSHPAAARAAVPRRVQRIFLPEGVVSLSLRLV